MGIFNRVFHSAEKAEKAADADTFNGSTQQIYYPQLVTLENNISIPSRQVCNEIYDTDENEEDCVIEQTFQMDNEFHQFESHAGEIDISYAYTPEICDLDEYCAWDVHIPYVAVMFDQKSYEILEQYERERTVPEGTVLYNVNHPLVKYKSVYYLHGDIYTSLYFYRGYDRELYYHMQAFYPEKVKGTEVEKKVLNALEVMANTYSEKRVVE